jgi:hypothetical protein
MMSIESAASGAAGSSQAVSSPESIPAETSTTPAIEAKSTTPPSTPSPTPTPAPTTLANSTQMSRFKTVSALQAGQFGSSSHGQPAGANERRNGHAKHLLQHENKAHA